MIKCDLPPSWTNISVGEYLDIQELIDNVGNIADEDKVMKEIQIIYGRNPYTMQMGEFKKCLDGIKFLSTNMPKMKVKDDYYLNGNRYYLHKKLNDFRVAQFMDFELIMKNNKGVDSYPQFISLFLTPSSNAVYGDGYDVGKVADDVRKYMSIADAFAIANFFLRQSKAYTVTFLWSIQRSTRKMLNRKERRELRRKTRKLIKMVIRGV
jgi:hypothetical protein